MEKNYILEFWEKSDFDIPWFAVENLKTKAEIRDFFVQYVKFLRKNIPLDASAIKTALSNIQYILNIFWDKNRSNFWEKCLKDYYYYANNQIEE